MRVSRASGAGAWRGDRWHQTLNVTTIRPKAPDTVEEARRLVAGFVQHCNHERLHSAIGF